MRKLNQDVNRQDCVLASICQLFEELDYESLRESYPSALVVGNNSLGDERLAWARNQLKQFKVRREWFAIKFSQLESLTKPLHELNLQGEGILSMFNKSHGHCVTFKDGMLYDPMPDMKVPQTIYNYPHFERGYVIRKEEMI